MMKLCNNFCFIKKNLHNRSQAPISIIGLTIYSIFIILHYIAIYLKQIKITKQFYEIFVFVLIRLQTIFEGLDKLLIEKYSWGNRLYPSP